MQNRIKKVVNLMNDNELRFSDAIDLFISRSIDTSECESVCLALGPRGNLTTLTAATLFLHPNCQVLNHAGTRIFGNKRVDFLSDYSDERFNRFIQFAIRISRKYRKKRGGSILYSHAFDPKYQMRKMYEKTGEGPVKSHIKCLFWKDSHRTTNLIQERQIDLGGILKQNDRLCFLQPIRNPMDCAMSNLKNDGHMRAFGMDRSAPVAEVTRVILNEIHWFGELQEEFPDRFFCYFEHEISEKMLIELAKFLRLDPDKAWLSNALSVMKTKPSYEHDSALLSFYRDYVAKKFSHLPDLSKRLLLYT